MSDLITTYNPANADTLTKEQIFKMQELTSAEIKELAAAYPNGATNRAYLLIIDKRQPVEKQLPSLSTFQNLWNLREKNGLRNYVAYQFRGNYKPVTGTKQGSSVRPKRTEVVDLADTDLMNLPGFKTADKEFPAQTVQVTKIKTKEVIPITAKPVVKRGRKSTK